MDARDFDDILGTARQLLSQLKLTYRDVAGEEFDLEGAVRHYPLVALTAAAGAGALGGWWVGRKMRPEPLQLPPPKPQSRLDRTFQTARDATEKLKQRRDTPPEETPSSPLDYLETILPEQIGRVRRILPEGAADEAATRAREWVDARLEPALQQSLERASASKFGVFFRETLQRFEGETPKDTELADPDTESKN